MQNLRSLPVDKIRQYHAKYYRPDNLCVIVAGQVDHALLLESLKIVEDKIRSKGSLPALARPWVTSKQPQRLTQVIQKSIKFPSEDEETGVVYVAWNGPNFSDTYARLRLEILLEYLTDSAVSLMQATFVELEEPLASDVSYHSLSYLQTSCILMFDGVPTEKLPSIQTLLFACLKSHLSTGIDMPRMKLIIERYRLQQLETVEADAADFFIRPCLYNFLYGNKNGEQISASFSKSNLDRLAMEPVQIWADCVLTSFIESPFVVVIGEPSNELSVKMSSAETDRITRQQAEYGEERLKQLGDIVDAAKKENDRLIPDGLLKSFTVPSVDIIKVPTVEYASTFGSDKASGDFQQRISSMGDSQNGSLKIQFGHTRSAFIDVTILFDTTSLLERERLFLVLYLDLMFHLPTSIDGLLLSHEQVISALDRDLVAYGNSVGVNGGSCFSVGSFSQVLAVSVRVEKEKYLLAAKWLHSVLTKSDFVVDRIKIACAKLMNEIPEHTRDGMQMCEDVLKSQLFDASLSNTFACRVTTQAEFLASIHDTLDTDPQQIITELEKLREKLNISSSTMHIFGDLMRMEDLIAPWTWLNDSKNDIHPVIPRCVMSPFGRAPSGKIFLAEMPAIESCFMSHVGKGPSAFNDPDIPALMVLNEYLTTMEGPFWKQVRGSGLAYGASMRLKVESGLVYFIIYRSPDCYKAFQVVQKIVIEFLDGKQLFEEQFLEAARSGVAYSVIAQEETFAQAAEELFANIVLRQVGANWNKVLLKEVLAVKMKDLKRCLVKYLGPLFSVKSSTGFATVPHSKLEDVVEGFAKLGYETELITLAAESDDEDGEH